NSERRSLHLTVSGFDIDLIQCLHYHGLDPMAQDAAQAWSSGPCSIRWPRMQRSLGGVGLAQSDGPGCSAGLIEWALLNPMAQDAAQA
ncbi:hypothetical protein CYMTET_17587, partial [Cymbomonas tetramitiformis]